MKKNRIRLTENSLRRLIKESIKNALTEGHNYNNIPQQEIRDKNGIQDADSSELPYHEDAGLDEFDFDEHDITYPNMSDNEFDNSEDDIERATTPEFDTHCEIDEWPRHRINTHKTQKQKEIDQAWNEHDSLNESRLNRIIRNNIRKVLY